MVLARQNGFGWHWLTLNLFGHFEIAHRAVFSLQIHLMPVDYRWALLAMLAMLGAAVWLLERSLTMLVGRGWMPVLGACYPAISVLVIPPMQWWSTDWRCFRHWFATYCACSATSAIRGSPPAVGLLFRQALSRPV